MWLADVQALHEREVHVGRWDNVRETLDDLVLVANLAALVDSMLLGSRESGSALETMCI
jgi:hypothetical protein